MILNLVDNNVKKDAHYDFTENNYEKESMDHSAKYIESNILKISQNAINSEEISEDDYLDTLIDIDTESVSRDVRFYLSFNKIRWGKFSSLVLGITQGRFSLLLKNPKPWNQMSIRLQSYYSRMKYWLDKRATYVPKKKKELNIKSTNRKAPHRGRKPKKKKQELLELDKSNSASEEKSNEDRIAATFIADLNEQDA